MACDWGGHRYEWHRRTGKSLDKAEYRKESACKLPRREAIPLIRPELNLQWQFNHNPSDADWNLTERKGWLLLKALKADHLRASRNMLTQKCIGYEGRLRQKWI